LCVKGIDFSFFYDFVFGFWNCSDSVVFFVPHFVPSLFCFDTFQARSSLYANTQLRAHRRAEKKIKSKTNMEDRLPEPITLQTRQNSIGKFLCTMRL
jgi:hypothetical protein